MKKLFTILTVLFFKMTVLGQVDPTIWDSLKTVSTDNYEFKIPYKWRQLPSGG